MTEGRMIHRLSAAAAYASELKQEDTAYDATKRTLCFRVGISRRRDSLMCWIAGVNTNCNMLVDLIVTLGK